ncbi:MAG: efflux RND transporter permease subunit, partial [Candidatus Eremiobacteraeota bacterium]|nr:efflux RND transporter permease subunit [Candidatus Eremiobacteraeota bacterium]
MNRPISPTLYNVFLTRFALRNPIAITLFYACIVCVGLLAVIRMGRSVLPPVALPVVTISAPYPGAGAKEVERLVIEPIEDQLDGLPDLDRVSASAQNGIAFISVRFRFGSNLDVARTNVQQSLDAARSNMPADLVPPVVSRNDPSQAPVIEESVSSAMLSMQTLSDLVDRQILPRLRAASGVGSVLTVGTRARQFTVIPDSAAMNALGLTALDVFAATSRSNAILPGGRFRSPLQDAAVGIDAAALSTASLRQVPVTAGGAQGVSLGELARVSDGYADQDVLSRVDGDAGVVLYVAHRQSTDSLQTIAAVRKTFARLAKQYPLVRFQTLWTDAPYTNAAVAGVLQTLGEGIVLTVLVMVFFLHAWRSAAIAAVAIPTSLCAAFSAMWLAGFTMNVLSLMGLSLTIGILVDDSIVIIEAIARNARQIGSAEEAALAGRRELGGAAIAITLVDVAVFLPIALTSGIVGEFMREFGMVIVFATAFSLLVSLTLTPLLAARWALRASRTPLKTQAKSFPWMFRTRPALRVMQTWHYAIERFNNWEECAARAYANVWLAAALRRGRAIGWGATALCVLALVPVFDGGIPTEFSPSTNKGIVTVDLAFPPGTPLAKTDSGSRRIAAVMLDDVSIKHVVTTAGRAFNGTSEVFASNIGEVGLILADPTSSGDRAVALVKALQPLVPDATLAGGGKGMGGTAQVGYSIAGDDEVIDAVASRLAFALRRNPFATDVRTSDGGLEPRLQISVDSRKAVMLDVKPDDAAQTARIATGGALAYRARLSSGLVDVIVRANGGE